MHNSCRSQIAETLGRHLAEDVFVSYSAGAAANRGINPDAVRLMKALYGIDMEKNQYPKTMEDIPKPDMVISMGCNVACPMSISDRGFDENWGLDDPTGKTDEEFKVMIQQIEEHILRLKAQCETRG